MAVNFKIVQRKSKARNRVYLTLDGDFDGTSAHELIIAVKNCGRGANQVFIDTTGLKSVHPFGQVVLQRNLSGLSGRCQNLVFLGDHGQRLSEPWLQ